MILWQLLYVCERTSDVGNGNHSVTLPIILINIIPHIPRVPTNPFAGKCILIFYKIYVNGWLGQTVGGGGVGGWGG